MNTSVKIVTGILILLIAGGVMLSAQTDAHGRQREVILDEIMADQNVDSITQVNPDLVPDELLDELGDAVMGLMIADERQHELMDRMMGGEGSEQLASMHQWLGYRYLQSGGDLSFSAWGPGMMGFGMMDGWNSRGWGHGRFGMMGWYGPWSWLFPVILVILIAIAVVLLLRKRGSAGGRKTPLEILKARYARGEITREEFVRIREDLG